MTQRLSDSPFPLQQRLDTETLAKTGSTPQTVIYNLRMTGEISGVAPKITNIFSS